MYINVVIKLYGAITSNPINITLQRPCHTANGLWYHDCCRCHGAIKGPVHQQQTYLIVCECCRNRIAKPKLETHVCYNANSVVINGTAGCHYSYAIMSTMASQINSLTIVYSTVYSQIKENIRTQLHWPLWGEFTGDRWNSRTKGQ